MLHFTLGKMYEDIGDHEKAFHNYHQANEFRKKYEKYLTPLLSVLGYEH